MPWKIFLYTGVFRILSNIQDRVFSENIKPFKIIKYVRKMIHLSLLDRFLNTSVLCNIFKTKSDNKVIFRSSHPEMLRRKGVLKICSKFTGEYSSRSVISTKLVCNFIEITFRHGCSPVNLLHIFRTPFIKNTSGWLPF